MRIAIVLIAKWVNRIDGILTQWFVLRRMEHFLDRLLLSNQEVLLCTQSGEKIRKQIDQM